MNLNNSNQFRLSRRAFHIVRCGQRLVAIAALLGCLVFRASTACHAAPPVDPVLHLPEKTPAWLQPYRVRYLLQVPGDREKSTAASVIAQLPTGGWLKPDASDLAVQSAAGEVLPVTVLSHDPAGGTLIQFTRSGNDAWYWAYAVAAKPQPQTAKPFEEGLTFEVRRWDGEDISSWTAVREGLEESKNVIGNGVVAEVIQNCNPVRPNDPRRFAASYRGFLKVEKEGVYRFFVNAEDSAFLFIDGFKVIESVGVTKRLTGTIPTRSIGVEVELTAGLHPLEVHHVIGNNPTAIGYCTLMWMPPEAKNWNYVPTTAFVHADLARVADVETPQKKGASPFVYGIDDTLRSGDGNLVYLVRFEAVGPAADDKKLVWDFGDGTTGVGRSLLHVYFMAGDYDVKLQSGDLPAFHSNVHVWPAPCNSSPLSLSMALNSLATSDWKKFNVARVHEMFQFLMICELPDRWPLLDAVAAHLLAQPNLDPKLKVLLCSGRMEAMAHQGQAAEAVELGKKMLPEFDRIPSLKAGVELEIAKIYQRHLNQLNEASKLYESIVTQHRRVEHPNVRIAAIRWGDLYAEAGDLARAGECYRLAEDLGGETFKTTALTGAVTRGGLLRTAEQKLREGDIQQTSQLLERIEMNYPQQKLEGLYRLLRADADRQTGHYDEAMRNYAILLELKQWSGFHDRALHGIADTQFRQGNYAKALEWLSKLQRVFPEYFESEKLADYQKQIIRRQTKAANSENGAKFEDFIFNFDPQKVDPKAVFRNINLAPALGIDGADTGMSFTPPGSTHEVHTILPLQNLTGAQHYWVELWYREQLQAALVRNQLVYILKGSDKMNPGGGVIKLHLERTFGQWRKAGFLCSNSETPDGTLAFTYHYQNGLVDIDGISVRAVTDREADALNNFLKGSEAE